MNAASALTLPLERQRANAILAERVTAATFVISDILAVGSAFAITVTVRGALAGESLWPQYFRLAPFLAAIPLLIALMDLYPGVLLNPVDEFRRMTIAIAVGMSFVVVSTFLLKDSSTYSRLVFLTAIPLNVVLALGGRSLVRKIFRNVAWWGVPTVLVGPRDDIERMRLAVELQPWIGIRAVGVVQADAVGANLLAKERIGQAAIPYALVMVPPGAGREWIRQVERMAWGCKKMIVVPQSMQLLWSWMRVRDCCGVAGLEVRRELLQYRSRLVKRSIDVALALIGGVLITPGLIVIALLIKLTSRGPVFYGHRRLGIGNATFLAWKFRTMVTNSDELLEQHFQQNPESRREWESDQKLRNDPRVTRVGHFLRRTSLDELPQIWNVINGEMSLVGPRPIVRAEAERYGEEFDLYQRVRPGMTGLWQVSGRSNTTYRDRVEMDVHYVRNWSVWLDFYLLARTVAVVLRKQGAY